MSRSFRHDPEEPGAARPRRHAASEPSVFRCRHCRAEVAADAAGTRHRNHCPHCLWSLHVDVAPGDRLQSCGGSMEPIAVWVKRDGEWALVHRCAGCHAARVNRIAGDDNEYALLALAARPMALPPFPVTRLRR